MSEKPPLRPVTALILAGAVLLLLLLLPTGKNRVPPRLTPEVISTPLTDLSGAVVRPLACKPGERAAVLVFISTDCPIANSYAPEIDRIAKDFSEREVSTFLVHVDPDLTVEEAARHASEYGLDRNASIVVDREHRLVKAVGATTTPEAAVVTSGARVLYLGRIDDLYADLGDKRAAPSEHTLREALEAILVGESVPNSRTKPIGCIIEGVADAASQ